MARAVAANASGRNTDCFVPERGHAKVVLEARVFLWLYGLLLIASLAFLSTVLFWSWIVPALIGQPFLRAYLLAEHALCPHVTNMLENTRSTFTTRLERLVAWNMPYHAEHYPYPAVPFHQLSRFHRIIAAHLRSTENGYARFHKKLIDTFG